MIYVNRDPEITNTMNRNDLSILAAEEGIIVDKIEEPGIYMTDNFNLIDLEEVKQKEIIEHSKKIIYYIADKTGRKTQPVYEMLKRKKKNIPHKIINRRIIYLISYKEANHIIKLIQEKNLRLLYYMSLKESIEFDNKYLRFNVLKNFKSNRLKLKKYKHKKIGDRLYILKEELPKFYKEIEVGE